MRDQAFLHAFRHVNRNGKPDALIPAAAAENRGVDADDFAVDIDKRPAAVARIDRRVSLDEIFIIVNADIRAAFGADNAGGHGLRQAERLTDGNDPVADFQRLGIAESGNRQIVGVDFNHSDIAFRVSADDFRFEFAFVG